MARHGTTGRRYPGSLGRFTWDAVACHGTTRGTCPGLLGGLLGMQLICVTS
ncbi:MAG: hypothetical protein ACI31F_06590 [Muribaculaceae bacterium]